MSPFPIVKNPDDRLRKKAVDVKLDELRNRSFQKFLDTMIQTMYDAKGIGLAASQIGDPRNVAIVLTKDGPLPLINPKITKKSFRTEWGEEGCLSAPGLWGDVKRSISLNAVAWDRDGKKLEISAKGLLARIIQHETDHLHGTLIIDKAKNVSIRTHVDEHDH